MGFNGGRKILRNGGPLGGGRRGDAEKAVFYQGLLSAGLCMNKISLRLPDRRGPDGLPGVAESSYRKRPGSAWKGLGAGTLGFTARIS